MSSTSTTNEEKKVNSDDMQDIIRQMKLDGKPLTTSNTLNSTLSLFGLLGIVFPVWCVTVLPLTIVWQIVSKVFLSKREIKSIQLASKVLEDAAKDDFVVSKDDIIPQMERTYDLLLIGSTGFTGRLSMRHLILNYHESSKSGSREKVRWAIAGRSKDKLEKVKKEVIQDLYEEGKLNTLEVDIDLIILDTLVRDKNLHNAIRDTRCVATTAGPFAQYGSNVVEFCAKYGTHYVDITGEQDWIRQMIHKWQSTAMASGAKIVPFCGHDSIPWDLTVDIMKQKFAELNEEMTQITCLNDVQGGQLSGGTLATALMALDGYKTPKYKNGDPWIELPYDKESVSGGGGKAKSNKSKFKAAITVMPEKIKGSLSSFASQPLYSSFFVMAGVNSQIVRRSHIFSEYKAKTHSKLVYKEGNLHLDFPTALSSTLSLVLGGTLLFNPVTRSIIEDYILPPGKGPSKDQRDSAHLCVYGIGTGSKGTKIESAMYFPKDAGYSETSRMLVESGLCLTQKKELVAEGGGFFTPSSAMGEALLERLCQTGTTYRCTKK